MKHIIAVAVIVSLAFTPNLWACYYNDLPNGQFASPPYNDWTFTNWVGNPSQNASYTTSATSCTLSGDGVGVMTNAGSEIVSNAFAVGTGGSYFTIELRVYVPNYASATAFDHVRVIVSDDLGRSESFTAYFNTMTSCTKTFGFNLSNSYNGRTVTFDIRKSQYSSMETYVDGAGFFRHVC